MSTTSSRQAGETDGRIARFMEVYGKAWAQPKSGRLAELWAEDAEMLHPEFTEPVHGRDAILAYLAQMLTIAPDMRVEPTIHVAQGDQLFIRFRSQGTFNGQLVRWEGVDHFELDGDRAVRGTGFFDTTAVRPRARRVR